MSKDKPTDKPTRKRAGMTFSDLERYRQQYRDQMPERDGFSPDQQIAMTTLHNQAVAGGSCGAIAVILSKPTLRVLFDAKVIDAKCRLTKRGETILKGWWRAGKSTS